jgi:biopolymer transport protein TolR
MASVSQRGSSRRRTINEINMVPFIDVMLVLLIIFMVTAPLITTGMVDLPSVGKSKARPEHVVEIMVAGNEGLKMRLDGKDESPVTLPTLVARVREAQAGNANTPVVISGDKAVKYEAIVKVMDLLQRGGVQRVGLSVKNNPG